MPVQHGYVAQFGKRRLLAFGGEGKRREADFLDAHGVDLGVHGAGDQLCTQADAQHGLAGLDALAHQLKFGLEEGVGLFVVGANGATQHDQQVSLHHLFGVKGFDGGVDVGEAVAGLTQNRGQGADVFEVDVAQCDGCFHVQTR